MNQYCIHYISIQLPIAPSMTIAITVIITISRTITVAITISSTTTLPIAIITGQQRIQQQTKTLVTIIVITIQQHDIINQFSQIDSSNVTTIMDRIRIIILILNVLTIILSIFDYSMILYTHFWNQHNSCIYIRNNLI